MSREHNVIKGTRLGVAFIIDLMASGWSTDSILAEYPHVTRDGLRAVFAFARASLIDARTTPVPEPKPDVF